MKQIFIFAVPFILFQEESICSSALGWGGSSEGGLISKSCFGFELVDSVPEGEHRQRVAEEWLK